MPDVYMLVDYQEKLKFSSQDRNFLCNSIILGSFGPNLYTFDETAYIQMKEQTSVEGCQFFSGEIDK